MEMFSNCRITFLGLFCCGSSDLTSSRRTGGTGRLAAVKDALCGRKLYPWIGGYQDSEFLQEVIWRLFLVVYFKLMDLSYYLLCFVDIQLAHLLWHVKAWGARYVRIRR